MIIFVFTPFIAYFSLPSLLVTGVDYVGLGDYYVLWASVHVLMSIVYVCGLCACMHVEIKGRNQASCSIVFCLTPLKQNHYSLTKPELSCEPVIFLSPSLLSVMELVHGTLLSSLCGCRGFELKSPHLLRKHF